jgi:DNA-binding NtrC family response regulator
MSTRPKILYVDDESDNLIVFKQAFSRQFDVDTASSGSEALEKIKSDTYDIIVSDQRMPSMTGVEMFQLLISAEHESARILMTGYADMQAVIDAINKGHIYFYCTKPWSSDELKMLFAKALEHVEVTRKNKLLLKEVDKSAQELLRLNEASSEILARLRID